MTHVMCPIGQVTHEVKCWPEFFSAILEGRKTFEIRVDDRGYQVGDYLLEREFDPTDYKNGGRGYTGQSLKVQIGYIGRHIPGLPPNVVGMSINNPVLVDHEPIAQQPEVGMTDGATGGRIISVVPPF
jgi:hypothetical protein